MINSNLNNNNSNNNSNTCDTEYVAAPSPMVVPLDHKEHPPMCSSSVSAQPEKGRGRRQRGLRGVRGSVLNAPKRNETVLQKIHENRQQLLLRLSGGTLGTSNKSNKNPCEEEQNIFSSNKDAAVDSTSAINVNKSSSEDYEEDDELSMLRKKQELLHSLLPQEIVDNIHHHWSPPSAGRREYHTNESITFSKRTAFTKSSSFCDSSIPSSIVLEGMNADPVNSGLGDSFHTTTSQGVAISTMSSSSSALYSENASNVSMVFIDIVGFSTISEEIPASDVMDMLQDLFHRFDEVCKNYNILKLDTIGDAYLCSAGCLSCQDICNDYQGSEYSDKQQEQYEADQVDDQKLSQQEQDGGLSHALRALAAAKDMVREARKVPVPKSSTDNDTKEEYLSVRVGIHVGDATYGVLGLSLPPKLVCIGSTVNMAARMEQTCTANMIHVTETFHDLIGDNEIGWECKEKVLIKNMGEVNAYLLDPFKEADESCWV